MEFTKISAPSLKELFIQQLEEKILSGSLSIGSRLPPERELAAMMKVSRAVVNGGITELAQKGFLEVRPRQGTYVADYRKNGNMQTLIALLEYRGGNLESSGIRAILEVRRSLEQLAVELLIDTVDTEALNNLASLAAKLSEAGNPSEAAQAAFHFHHTLACLGGNTVLTLIYSSFKEICIVLWERFCRLYGTDTLYKNTAVLLNYINKRDKEGAFEWIQHYLGEAIAGSQQIYGEDNL